MRGDSDCNLIRSYAKCMLFIVFNRCCKACQQCLQECAKAAGRLGKGCAAWGFCFACAGHHDLPFNVCLSCKSNGVWLAQTRTDALGKRHLWLQSLTCTLARCAQGIIQHATINNLAFRAQRGGDAAHPAGHPVRAGEPRRGLPGRLEARGEHHEARPQGLQGVLCCLVGSALEPSLAPVGHMCSCRPHTERAGGWAEVSVSSRAQFWAL